MQPKCQYFGKCGGCQIQHLPYELQLKNKAEFLKHIFKTKIEIIHGPEYNYRNRMDFVFGNNRIGLRKANDHKKIIDIEQCPISNTKINKLLKEVREYFLGKDLDYFDVLNKKGTLRYATIRATEKDSSITFILNSDSMKLGKHIDYIKTFVTSAKNVLVAYVPSAKDVSTSMDYAVIKGEEYLIENLGKDLKFHTQGFFQNNSNVAKKMVEHVTRLCDGRDTFVDLYGGVGTFAAHVNANKKIVVEEFPLSTKYAAENCNAEIITKDAAKYRDYPEDAVIVTDPPRSGMGAKAIKQMLASKPAKIIYISCNPKQLQKELYYFKDYKIKSVALFDMFPQTNHIECCVEFNKE